MPCTGVILHCCFYDDDDDDLGLEDWQVVSTMGFSSLATVSAVMGSTLE